MSVGSDVRIRVGPDPYVQVGSPAVRGPTSFPGKSRFTFWMTGLGTARQHGVVVLRTRFSPIYALRRNWAIGLLGIDTLAPLKPCQMLVGMTSCIKAVVELQHHRAGRSV